MSVKISTKSWHYRLASMFGVLDPVLTESVCAYGIRVAASPIWIPFCAVLMLAVSPIVGAVWLLDRAGMIPLRCPWGPVEFVDAKEPQ